MTDYDSEPTFAKKYIMPMGRTALEVIASRVAVNQYTEAWDVPIERVIEVVRDKLGDAEVEKWRNSEYLLRVSALHIADQHSAADARVLLSIIQDQHLDELQEIRVRPDHKVYVSGTSEMMVRAAWQDGYQCGVEDCIRVVEQVEPWMDHGLNDQEAMRDLILSTMRKLRPDT